MHRPAWPVRDSKVREVFGARARTAEAMSNAFGAGGAAPAAASLDDGPTSASGARRLSDGEIHSVQCSAAPAIDFANRPLQQGSVRRLARALTGERAAPALRTLRLTGSSVQDAGAVDVARLLRRAPGLVAIDLEVCVPASETSPSHVHVLALRPIPSHSLSVRPLLYAPLLYAPLLDTPLLHAPLLHALIARPYCAPMVR